MRKIKLTQNQFALVDDADYDWLNQWKWCAKYSNCTHSFYAVRNSPRRGGRRYLIYMSRLILGLEPGDKRQGDHRNHNTLDNRRNNIRICTHQENTINKKPQLKTSSRFKGVSWNKQRKKWGVYIYVMRKLKFLGYFDVEIFAALAYNSAAKKYFGEFACLN